MGKVEETENFEMPPSCLFVFRQYRGIRFLMLRRLLAYLGQ